MERKTVWAEAQIRAAWGGICASGAPNDFSRSPETPNAPTHYSDEPDFGVRIVCGGGRQWYFPSGASSGTVFGPIPTPEGSYAEVK